MGVWRDCVRQTEDEKKGANTIFFLDQAFNVVNTVTAGVR